VNDEEFFCPPGQFWVKACTNLQQAGDAADDGYPLPWSR